MCSLASELIACQWITVSDEDNYCLDDVTKTSKII